MTDDEKIKAIKTVLQDAGLKATGTRKQRNHQKWLAVWTFVAKHAILDAFDDKLGITR